MRVLTSVCFRSLFLAFFLFSRCFFFNDTATTEIYTLSLHDALPISATRGISSSRSTWKTSPPASMLSRSEEHTSELQSRVDLVCRLLLEKKKTRKLRRSQRG